MEIDAEFEKNAREKMKKCEVKLIIISGNAITQTLERKPSPL